MNRKERESDRIKTNQLDIDSWRRGRSLYPTQFKSDLEFATYLADKYCNDVSFLRNEIERLTELYDACCEEVSRS